MRESWRDRSRAPERVVPWLLRYAVLSCPACCREGGVQGPLALALPACPSAHLLGCSHSQTSDGIPSPGRLAVSAALPTGSVDRWAQPESSLSDLLRR